MQGNTITVKKNVVVNRHQDLAYFAEKKDGYVGKMTCGDPVKVFQSKLLYEGRYPKACTTGDSARDGRHFTTLPGWEHPHVIMIDDFFYTLCIELP